MTDDDWKVVERSRDRLVGKIQERYGITREEAERQLGEDVIEHLSPQRGTDGLSQAEMV